LELRAFYYDPGYCLGSGGSPAVLAMTISPNTDLGRRAETHLATITATSNFILFHAGHRKLGMSDRNRDNLLMDESRKRVQEIIADKLSPSGWSWAVSQRLIPPGNGSSLPTLIVGTGSVSLCAQMKSSLRFLT